jgi:DNA topoisomerase-1
VKFDRLLVLSRSLPAIRARVRRDLARRGLAREKVIAAVVQLLEDTSIRVGNEEYVRANRSYGLTTLRDDHVAIDGDRIRFEFRGKRGKEHRCRIRDRALARVLTRCRALPGEELFQYVDESAAGTPVDSGDVNAYLRRISGEDLSAKDFRTWSGTVLAARTLALLGEGRTLRGRRRRILAALDAVAEVLNNTRAVCRKFYVHPALLQVFEQGSFPASLRRAISARRTSDVRVPATELSPLERALVRFLEHRPRTSTDRC